MKATHDAESTFFNTLKEELFLFSLLNRGLDVLEFGSGASTLAIAKRVRSIVSIEHDPAWKHEVMKTLPDNAELYHVPRNSQEASGNDGTYSNYKDYIEFPLKLNRKFDIVFVDGRARVECCKVAMKLLSNESSCIILHDVFNPDAKCDRPEYREILDFLHPVAGEYSLWMFKPKRNL